MIERSGRALHAAATMDTGSSSGNGSSAAAARASSGAGASSSGLDAGITYRQYKDEESDLPAVMDLIDRSLSEPYSVFTYRYFLQQWPQLCFLALDNERSDAPVGVIVCKCDDHRGRFRGYIAMLVVDEACRGRGLGRALARMAIAQMAADGAAEVVLEAEVGNSGALSLYRSLGFVRDKHLHRYYLNNQDAYRLKLLLPSQPDCSDGNSDELPAQTQLLQAPATVQELLPSPPAPPPGATPQPVTA